jgi:transcriptional regulator with XRE-family HTH domain
MKRQNTFRNTKTRAIGRLLATLRRETGNLSKAQFATLLGWKPGKLARLESGDRRFTIRDLAHIAYTLQLDLIRLAERFFDCCRFGVSHIDTEHQTKEGRSDCVECASRSPD